MKKHLKFTFIIFIILGLTYFSFTNEQDNTQNNTQSRENPVQVNTAPQNEGRAEQSNNSSRDNRSGGVRTINKRKAAGYFSAGIKAFRKKNYRKSVKWFTRATEYNPQRARYFYFLGRALDHIKNYPASLEALKKAQELDTELSFTQNPERLKKKIIEITELAKKHGDMSRSTVEGIDRGRSENDGEQDRNREGQRSPLWNILGFSLLGLAAFFALIYFIRKKRKSY